MSEALPPSSIKAEARKCRKRFEDLLSLRSEAILPLATILQDEYGRFNLWAATLAVFAPYQACLDFRLKDVPEASDVFIKQLCILDTRIEQLHEQLDLEATNTQSDLSPTSPAPPELWAVEDIISSIRETISWIQKLSNVVRKASAATQDERAATFVLRDETGTDISEYLRSFYQALIQRDCKDIDKHLKDRIVHTMLLRRKRILYRKSRQRRWMLHQADETRKKLEVLPTLPNLRGKDGNSTQEADSTTVKADSPELSQAPSTLAATNVEPKSYVKQATASRISRATSAPFEPRSRLLIPPRPEAANKGTEFLCDYCCLIIPSTQATDLDKWAKHVKKDLDPYICIFDQCPNPYQLYSSSEEWLGHMISQHRTRWHCPARDHPHLALGTRDELITHLEQIHPGRFEKAQLGSVADSCARADYPTIQHCPFCSEQAGDLNIHVGQHLQCFALQSLPWPEHLTHNTEGISKYGSD
ncbi:hypothetical protein C7999DRAFT_17466, partial [Corynascus novoguineensis]